MVEKYSMNSWKNFLDFLIQTNIIVALSAGALTKITLLKFRSESDLIPLLVVCATVLSYNYIRLTELREERLSWYYEWFRRNKILFYGVNILAFIGLLGLLFVIPIKWESVITLVPFLVLTFLYVKPAIFRSNWKALRAVPILKILNIAFCWAGVTVLFPVIQEFRSIDELVWIAFFERFLFVFALTIPFDIRDVGIDSKNMQTIPQIIGIKSAKIVAVLFLILVVLLEYSYFTFWYFQGAKMVVIFLYLSILIWNTNPNQHRYYTSFWVEVVPILWLLLILYL